MRMQLRATMTIYDEQWLIETAQERAAQQGGDPEDINDVGAALKELFDLVDSEGSSIHGGLALTGLESIQLCDNEECCRKEHR